MYIDLIYFMMNIYKFVITFGRSICFSPGCCFTAGMFLLFPDCFIPCYVLFYCNKQYITYALLCVATIFPVGFPQSMVVAHATLASHPILLFSVLYFTVQCISTNTLTVSILLLLHLVHNYLFLSEYFMYRLILCFHMKPVLQ